VIPKVVLVDLDAAIGKDSNNREAIKHLRRRGLNNIFGVGGGIRSLEALNYYLNDISVPRAIISSNLELLDHLARETIENRIIVELSINENN
jgi:phosphoribosylformimino-5-aminoimidazole carboxamide ribonucleotide (ProFAR) isomerase